MSITERDAIRRERAAVDAAVAWVFREASRLGGIEQVDARRLAEILYPRPSITRPRVVRDPQGSLEWTVIDGTLRTRRGTGLSFFAGEWMRWREYKEFSDCAPLPARVAMWADLLANPTETVEDDS